MTFEPTPSETFGAKIVIVSGFHDIVFQGILGL